MPWGREDTLALTMLILFCSDPLALGQPDDAFAAEAQAARLCGCDVGLIHFEALVEGQPISQVLCRVPRVESPRFAVYRGWMLHPAQYERLFVGLVQRDIFLVNPPAMYTHAHHLPASYDVVREWMPRTVWTHEVGPGAEDAWMRLLEPFGDRPVLVKDFVKSRKHEWAEACFIPSARDREAVSRVARRFLELQGEDLNEGLVFREFVEFVPLAGHPRSGMPRVREFRVFVLHGKPLLEVPYWDDVDQVGTGPALRDFADVFSRVRSQFFTVDFAQRRDDGRWMIVELGEAQVSGLPERADREAFFRELRARMAPYSGMAHD